MNYKVFIILFCFLVSCGTDDSPTNQQVPSDSKPTLTMQALTVAEGDQNKSVFVSLRLDKASSTTINVSLSTESRTAEADKDFIAIDDLQIVFSPGDVQEECQIQLLADDEAEPDEFFNLKINSIEGAEATVNEIAITIEDDDVDGEIFIPSEGYTTPTTYDGMNLTWSDEFDGTELDESIWTYEIGNGEWGWGNNELQFYRKENTLVTDGHMVIQAREQNFGGFNYTSSRLITRDKFEFTHGRVDIRALMPKGQGIWPALWMLGANLSEVGWPRCGEVDIMELLGHQPNIVHGTVHYADPNGNRILNTKTKTLSGADDFSDRFHVFSIVWKEDVIEWYVDDQKYHTVTKSILGTQNPYPFNDPFFFIVNVAVGGQWPGSPDGSTIFPQNMIIDYIRVFQEE